MIDIRATSLFHSVMNTSGSYAKFLLSRRVPLDLDSEVSEVSSIFHLLFMDRFIIAI